MKTETELGGWWVVDRNHNDFKYRGPYTHPETAGAVRTEMERNASDSRNEYWNLAVVRITNIMKIEP